MSLGTLGANLLGNQLTSKGTITAGESTVKAAEETIRAGWNVSCRLIL